MGRATERQFRQPSHDRHHDAANLHHRKMDAACGDHEEDMGRIISGNVRSGHKKLCLQWLIIALDQGAAR